MSPPWDVWLVGYAMGGASGLILGYQTRKLVEHVGRLRDARRANRTAAVDQVSTIEREAPPVGTPLSIPLNQRATFRWAELPAEPALESQRDEVIAALMGSGYKKAEAIRATDACTAGERSCGNVTLWTVAALRNARKS